MTIQRLRADAIRRTLFKPTRLKTAIERLGFVQADPIRAPARAQDLILRHRVTNYLAGDLERRYAELEIEEDVFYAYGFLPRANWQLLHPRNTAGLSKFDAKVFEVVTHYGTMHPRELEQHLGRQREVNAWGGYSKATTRALHHLHFRGLLRVAKRESGIRIYQSAGRLPKPLSPGERARKAVLLAAAIFAPVPLQSLREILAFLRRAIPWLELRAKIVDALLTSGELVSDKVETVSYLWPANSFRATRAPGEVKFLAPFDPLVWDRRRFEHLWGWRYRFEAYTPPAKRQRGYYAMPLLWTDEVIGWANLSLRSKRLSVDLGFVGKRPDSADFRHALEEEIERVRNFLSEPATALTNG